MSILGPLLIKHVLCCASPRWKTMSTSLLLLPLLLAFCCKLLNHSFTVYQDETHVLLRNYHFQFTTDIDV